MDKFLEIVKEALNLNASDIHLVEGLVPMYRVKRRLVASTMIEPMNKYDLEGLLEALVGDRMPLVEQFEAKKKVDLSYEVNESVRLRINASMSKNEPTFSIRFIRNSEIDISKFNLSRIIDKVRNVNSGLILITGSVNSGKTTTLNAIVQELNKEVSKKIVMLEEPIEYRHKSNKCLIVQKEVREDSDVPTYYDGVINLLREDSDIAIIGEIRDRVTMDAAIELAESGGLVIGTLHTRSCGETIERILAMYNIDEQRTIKYALSSTLRLVMSQKIVLDSDHEMIMVPEMLVNNNTVAALIRQDSFSISQIKDAIHSGGDDGMISYEKSFRDLISKNKITLESVKPYLDEDSLKLIINMIGGDR